MSFARASSDELKKLKESILRDPLTGRNVMIPFTSKAFFPGLLKPTIGENNEEQILVKLSSQNFLEMSRTEANNLIDKRIQTLQEESAAAKVVTENNNNNNNNTKQQQLQDDDDSPPLAYFDIREEYDSKGNVIYAKATNIAKELEYLQRKEDENPDSIHQSPLPRNNDEIIKDYNEDVQQQKQPVTNEEYEKLSSRLSELASMEEEAEKEAKKAKSMGGLQGSGWAKGFLNNEKKKKKSSADKGISTSPTDRSLSNNKKVNFVQNVGTNNKRSTVTEKSSSNKSTKNVTTKSKLKTFDQNVFSGIVKERVGDNSRTSKNLETKAEAPKKKKLSLFAQRRLQEQQGL